MYSPHKKSQAAMEFLLTYGWAIVAVLVVFGALTYFKVLDPSKLLPETCNFGPGIGKCIDFEVTSNKMTLTLMNGLGDPVTFTGVKNSGCNGGDIVGDILVFSPAVTLKPGETGKIELYGCHFESKKKVSAELDLIYFKGSEATGLTHIISGQISADVKEAGAGSPPAGCNDGDIDPGEQCDSTDFGGKTCLDNGFEGGSLACFQDCSVDTSGCSATAVCGDGFVAPSEGCDDGNTGSGDGCTAACVVEICGDGIIQNFPGHGEECDGTSLPGVICAANCKVSGLLAFYPMNWNAKDYSGNSRDGTALLGAVLTTGSGGKYGAAYDFSGSSGPRISIPIINIPDNTPWTVAYWFYQRSTTKISMGANAQTDRFLHVNAGTSFLNFYNHVNTQITLNAASYNLNNNWHHAVVVCDGAITSSIKLYIDGAYYSSGNMANSNLVIDSIGYATGSSTGWAWDGRLDEVRIYNRALSLSEISTIKDFDSSKLSQQP
ncbi:MAG: hypothetical protein NT001_01120 [Candidatus Woesearchaeota archaeon]|nr:hypothetical protein [Candidatus Woesearchaeota archaeon]